MQILAEALSPRSTSASAKKPTIVSIAALAGAAIKTPRTKFVDFSSGTPYLISEYSVFLHPARMKEVIVCLFSGVIGLPALIASQLLFRYIFYSMPGYLLSPAPQGWLTNFCKTKAFRQL
ncbi:hypothetical protein CEXT_539581 [Caerostris extrusa]|uniref:Uncharacterized protein n=1 Tax=Caerostris extrusa TaxID=172846 RepID=A0AAV4T936_CAEEX|nr:hypothetical protein CEXT_539581 [Caerostris extrusa]